jgi:hypothetical protein
MWKRQEIQKMPRQVARVSTLRLPYKKSSSSLLN